VVAVESGEAPEAASAEGQELRTVAAGRHSLNENLLE
jgi:hypothetical protein